MLSNKSLEKQGHVLQWPNLKCDLEISSDGLKTITEISVSMTDILTGIWWVAFETKWSIEPSCSVLDLRC